MSTIDYKKFDTFSKYSQKELIDFARMLLSSIEIFDLEQKNEITLYDFQKGKFDTSLLTNLWHKLNTIIGDKIIEMSHPLITGWGPERQRRLKMDLTIVYKPDSTLVLKEFLEKVDTPKDDNANKIGICINDATCLLYKKSDSKAKCAFQGKGGTNQRLKYILTIAKARKPVRAASLNKNYQALSTEIANINRRIRKGLKLTENFIINPDSTGYRINSDAYNIEFV